MHTYVHKHTQTPLFPQCAMRHDSLSWGDLQYNESWPVISAVFSLCAFRNLRFINFCWWLCSDGVSERLKHTYLCIFLFTRTDYVILNQLQQAAVHRWNSLSRSKHFNETDRSCLLGCEKMEAVAVDRRRRNIENALIWFKYSPLEIL